MISEKQLLILISPKKNFEDLGNKFIHGFNIHLQIIKNGLAKLQ